MKIAYISTYKTVSIENWSGTEYFMAKALEKYFEVEYITGLKTKRSLLLIIKQLFYCLFGKKYVLIRTASAGHDFARQLKARLSKDIDLIFSPSTIPVAYLDTTIPIVIYTDASFASMLDYYDNCRSFCKETISDAMQLEQRAFDVCKFAVFSSDWAAKAVLKHYVIVSDKLKVIPFGANLEHEKTLSEIEHALDKRERAICKILFVGVHWARKGGDKALEIVNLLNEQGLHTELHVVGISEIPTKLSLKHVTNHGFISKSQSDGLAKFEKLALNSHFLLVPSLTEAYGIVFCESAAYALPAIGTKTGGITTIIKDGINGQTFDLDSPALMYANYISTLFADQEAYRSLAISSYHEYLKCLNWNVAGKTLYQMILNEIT